MENYLQLLFALSVFTHIVAILYMTSRYLIPSYRLASRFARQGTTAASFMQATVYLLMSVIVLNGGMLFLSMLALFSQEAFKVPGLIIVVFILYHLTLLLFLWSIGRWWYSLFNRSPRELEERLRNGKSTDDSE